MKLYSTTDARKFEASNAHGIVALMATRSFGISQANEQYRAEVAARLNDEHNFPIDPSTDETFVRSLVACGLFQETPLKPADGVWKPEKK